MSVEIKVLKNYEGSAIKYIDNYIIYVKYNCSTELKIKNRRRKSSNSRYRVANTSRLSNRLHH